MSRGYGMRCLHTKGHDHDEGTKTQHVYTHENVANVSQPHVPCEVLLAHTRDVSLHHVPAKFSFLRE